MRKVIFFISVLFFAQTILYSQETRELSFDEYIKQMEPITSSSSGDISFKVNYKSFENHITEVPYDVFNGFYAKKGNEQEVFQLGAYVYQNDDKRIVVDTSKKSIVITDPERNQEAFDEFMKNKNFLNENYIDKVLKDQSGDQIKYIIKLKNFKYNKIVVLVTEKFIKKIIMLFDQPVVDNTSEEVRTYYPRVEIEFFEVNLEQPVKLKRLFDPERHLQKTDNQYKALGRYTSYRVFDARIKNK